MRSFDALLRLSRSTRGPQRRAAILGRLRATDPRVVAHWLGQLLRRGLVDGRAREAQLGIFDAWLALEPDLVAEVRAAAALGGDRLVSALLDDQVTEAGVSPRARRDNLGRYEHWTHHFRDEGYQRRPRQGPFDAYHYDPSWFHLDPEELRRARIASNAHHLLDQLRHPDPARYAVIARSHPLVERNYVDLANTRPLDAELARRVLESPFRTRPTVRRALVANATAPTSLRLALLPLATEEWREQARKGNRPVARLARMLLELRRTLTPPPPRAEPRPPERTLVLHLGTTEREPTTLEDEDSRSAA